jgi:hypothetical protein
MKQEARSKKQEESFASNIAMAALSSEIRV